MEENNREVHPNYSVLYEGLKKEKLSTCYSLTQLQAFYDQDLEETRHLEIADHIRTCDLCSVELEYIKLFNAEESESEAYQEDVRKIKQAVKSQLETLLVSQFPRQRPQPFYLKLASSISRPKWIAAMSSAAIAVASLLFFAHQEPPLPGPTADVGSKSSVRGDRVELLYPLGELNDRPSYLMWEKAPGARGYALKITEVDANVVWSVFSSDNKMDLPADLRDKLVRTKTYYWYVEAKSENGNTIKKSVRGTFKIK